ncbi:unnamed protein product, partial [Linum tenue]
TKPQIPTRPQITTSLKYFRRQIKTPIPPLFPQRRRQRRRKKKKKKKKEGSRRLPVPRSRSRLRPHPFRFSGDVEGS